MRHPLLRGSRKRPPAAPPENPWDVRLGRLATALGVGLVLLSIPSLIYWHFSSARHPGFLRPAAHECRALYADATTRHDTARVDLTHPALASQKDPNLPTCGTLRQLGELDSDTSRPPQN